MLYGRILRSPYPHARIKEVKIEKARRVEGVKAVVTGKDIATGNSLFLTRRLTLRTRPPSPWIK
jgi:CO/xanthine dehydrogenase Mo-binding subunit